MPKPFSIRDHLERAVWRDHHRFAQRHARQRWMRRRRALAWPDRLLFILAACLLLLLILRVEAVRAADDAEPFWGIEAVSSEDGYRAVALDTDIDIEVTGLAARIEVTQVFRNGGPAWREAIYRFPLPPGAAVDRLRVEADDRLIEGEIQEKAEARRQDRQARSDGRLATLVEQERPNQFETRLANIGAGETIRVTIGFLARVDFRDGSYSLGLPLTFTPRWSPGDRGTGRLHHFVTAADSDSHFLAIDVLLRTGQALSRLESRYHDIDIQAEPGTYRVSLVDPDTRTDRRFELVWAPEYGAEPTSTLTTWDGGDAVYALLMLAPPAPEAIEPRPREVVFVVDTSGSMDGTSIEQARAALAQGLAFLDPEDRFNVLEFNSDTRALFEESMPALPWYQEQAVEFIADLEADGGTNMGPALDLAMALPTQDGLLRQIVFVTDGSVGNERELLLQVGGDLVGAIARFLEPEVMASTDLHS